MENDIRADDSALLELASMIDEGREIDWDSEEIVAHSEDERAILAELRVLAALTRVYRDPDAFDEAGVPELAADPANPPTTWASLTILNPVGKGGFAPVYRARDVLGRDVALKLFPLTAENAGGLAARVLREGSLLARIKHRNVVVVHGVEQASGFIGLWMEFINGRTIEEELQARGRFSAEEATPIGVDLCRALAEVHGSGLVHRDVKAQNVMREERGRTVLMDFGAGTELAADPGRALDMAGTPLYLAPELFDGLPATEASDIYSLGVLLYRLVTKEYPVRGADRFEIQRAHRAGMVTRLLDRRPDLPGGFIRAVERALSPDPAARPQTAGEFAAALTGGGQPVQDSAWQRYRRVLVGASAAVLIVAAAAAWWAESRRNQPPIDSARLAASAPPAPAPVIAPDPAYSVRAVMSRTRKGVEAPLTAGMELAGGDQLSLRIEASRDVYVYLLNADDTGKSYRLFPLPDRQPDNPLTTSTPHRLPSDVSNWVVTDEGGREHFVIIVTPARDAAIEAIVKTIPPATEGRPVTRAAFSNDQIGVLRSVGGLTRTTPAPRTSDASLLWYEGAGELTGNAENASGTWMRRLTVPGSAR